MTFDSMRDRRLDQAVEAESQEGVASPTRCEACGGQLPRGLGRVRCLAHSPYAQEVAREVERRSARGQLRRAA